MSSVLEQFGRGAHEAGDHTKEALKSAFFFDILDRGFDRGFDIRNRIFTLLKYPLRMAGTAVATTARAIGTGAINTVKAAGKAVLSAPIVPVKTGKKLGEAL